MTNHLTPQQLAAYERDGFLCPIRVLSGDGLADCQQRVQDIVTRVTNSRDEHQRMQFKAHLLYQWLDELVRHPAILDAIESLLGPDLLVWNSGFLIKKPRDPSFVSWHQDATYWGLEPMEVASVWLALVDSTPANGCVRCLPGTDKLEQIAHRDTHAKNNLLSRGQEIALDIDESKVVDLVLRAGEMSLHHVRVIHGSQPNHSDEHRVGFIINYVPPHVRQRNGDDSALLVRGTDRYGHFKLEPRAKGDFHPEGVAAHERAMAWQLTNILRK